MEGKEVLLFLAMEAKGGDGGSSIFSKSGQGGKDGQCTLSIFKKCIKGKDAKNVKNNRKENLIK